MVKTKDLNKFNFGKYFAAHKIGLFFYVFIYLITGTIDIVSTIYFAKMIELLTQALYVDVIKIILFLTFCMVTQRVLWFVNGLNYCNLYAKITSRMSVDVAEQAFKISSGSYSQHNTASFMQRISSDPRTIFDNIAMIINQCTEIITNAVMLVYICTINIWIGLISAVGIVVASVIEKWRRAKRKKNRRELKVSSEKVDSLLNEIVRSERDVKSLNLEQTLKTKTEDGFADYKKKYLKRYRFFRARMV